MSADVASSHYEVLGVSEQADARAIEMAYRAALAKIRVGLGRKQPLPVEFLDSLRDAYQTLSDASRRAVYDLERSTRTERSEPRLESTVTDTSPPAQLTAVSAAATGQDEPIRFEFTGTGGDYFRIWIVNLALSVLTLGIYSAWAKVRREQFFHRNTMLAGSGFDYHGDPKAILKGRLIAWSLLLIMGLSQQFNLMLYGVLLLCAVPVMPWLLMRSLKFRAANTSYRGLRFHHRGTYGSAFVAFVVNGLPIIFFGFWLPMWVRAIRRFQLDKLSFGQANFKCTPSAGGFFGTYFKAGLLAIVPMLPLAVLLMPMMVDMRRSTDSTVSAFAEFLPLIFFASVSLIIRPYISARLANLTWNATSVGGSRFISTQSYRSYFAIVLGNFVLIVLTLGLYWPWAKVREANYRLARLELEAVNLDTFVARADREKSAVGEEIADAFDLEFSL